MFVRSGNCSRSFAIIHRWSVKEGERGMVERDFIAVEVIFNRKSGVSNNFFLQNFVTKIVTRNVVW